MMSRAFFLLVALSCIGGCTDTIDTVTREYRNTNNEAIDAMMMVTNEETAQTMTKRVFKHLSDRYKDIDRRLMIVENNSATRKDFMKAVLQSDGMHMYWTELGINRQRFSLELTRLKMIKKDYIDKKYAELVEQGQEDPVVNESEVCRALDNLLRKDGILDRTVRKQLHEPDLNELYMKNFPNWKVDDYPKLLEEFRKRREIFLPKEQIRLAY